MKIFQDKIIFHNKVGYRVFINIYFLLKGGRGLNLMILLETTTFLKASLTNHLFNGLKDCAIQGNLYKATNLYSQDYGFSI